MPGIFVTATDARTKSRNNTVIHSEITSIENAVYANIDAGVLYANVNNSTMTNSNVYYNVHNGVTTDATKKDQLDYVKKYSRLRYGVNIFRSSATPLAVEYR